MHVNAARAVPPRLVLDSAGRNARRLSESDNSASGAGRAWPPIFGCYRRRRERRQPSGPAFRPALRRLRRDRAAAAVGDADYLLRRAADELIERLRLVKRRLRRRARSRLRRRLPDGAAARARARASTAADPGAPFAARGGGVQCDEDRLPFADGALRPRRLGRRRSTRVNDLPGALLLIRRALRPDGLFLAAFAGAGSLPRLRSAMRAAEEAEGGAASPRIHPQIDVRAAGDLLARAGFALPVADVEGVDGPLLLAPRGWSPTCGRWARPTSCARRGGPVRPRSASPPRSPTSQTQADPDGKTAGAVRDPLSERLGALPTSRSRRGAAARPPRSPKR